jgi:hypothetical protein
LKTQLNSPLQPYKDRQNISKRDQKTCQRRISLRPKKPPEHTNEDTTCAQTVLLTFYELTESKSKNNVIPKIAAGFGGGMGQCGTVLWCLTGSLMAVGIKCGSNEAGAEKQAKAYALAKSYTGNMRSSMERFTVGSD